MAETVNEDSGVGRSVEESSNGQGGKELSESRSYWDTDEDDEDGLKPSELFGRHKWKIEKFSEYNARDLRSSDFKVGGYGWYILLFPQGRDVCHHISLFLCVSRSDKLPPGWSRLAQFTITLVNKDPKKSKCSDTLHEFWKKEHDWGWKKYIEIPRLQEGFLDDSGCLTIEAQVQVIREKVDRPFRCLESRYRRELVRGYLSNVEQIFRSFVEERRSKLGKVIEDKAKWSSFGDFWLGMDQNSRCQISREKMDVILKDVVKHFFIVKEHTSTLVMDSLYSGLKALEDQSKNKESPTPIVSVDKDMFVIVDDALLLLERTVLEPLPPKEENVAQNRIQDANEANDQAAERDERRLTELGRQTVEIFVLDHIFSSKMEAAYQEDIALKLQEELIREDKEASEKEKKSKKKQTKKKKNKN